MGGVKTGIQVVRDLDEVAEEVDALEVRQEILMSRLHLGALVLG